jgi:tRNA threonylcarbamoyladenosine biosynthesis protein TsaB
MSLLHEPFFLVVNTTYSAIELGVYAGSRLICSARAETKQASSHCIPLIQELLETASLSLEQLDFIAAYQGPAPFTTLRTALATVNGLAFATGIPTLGINGLEAFARSVTLPDYDRTYVLLHAFGKDLYTGIFDTLDNKLIFCGCLPITELLEQLKKETANKILCVGNGARMHQENLASLANITIPEQNPESCSLKAVAQMALDAWHHKTGLTKQIVPLYLKDHPATQQ